MDDPIDKRVAKFIYEFVLMIPSNLITSRLMYDLFVHKNVDKSVDIWYLCDTVLSIGESIRDAVNIIRNWWLKIYYKPGGKYAQKVCAHAK